MGTRSSALNLKGGSCGQFEGLHSPRLLEKCTFAISDWCINSSCWKQDRCDTVMQSGGGGG